MINAAHTLAPSATTQIRADHAHVLTTFHQYRIDSSPETKRIIVNTICRALAIHARLEEEVFYPAMYELAPALIEKSLPEHADMRHRVAALLASSATPPDDSVFFALMRDVIRHVADEETLVLPEAERVISRARLNELGAEMVMRRVNYIAETAGDLVRDALRVPDAGLMLAGSGAVIASTYFARQVLRR